MDKTSSRKLAVINADDFGFSPGITAGILQAHRQGIVTSTTIAANMPSAAEAVRQLAEVPDLGVGVHLNISQGPPLSKEALALAGDDGILRMTAVGVILTCIRRPWMLSVIEAEFDAQIRWVLDHGIRPTHLDSHRHAHGFPPILRRVIHLAKRYNVRHVRRIWESLPGAGWQPGPTKQRRTRRVLNAFSPINRRIGADFWATEGTWGVEHTGGIDAAWLIQAAGCLPQGVTEIMTHPGLPDAVETATSRLGASRPRELASLCDPAVKAAFKANGVGLVHYGQI